MIDFTDHGLSMVLLMIVSLFFYGPMGVVYGQPVSVDTSGVEEDSPPIVLEQAEQVRWDPNARELITSGGVQVHYGERQITADTVIYEETTGWVRAIGHAKATSSLGQNLTGNMLAFHPATNRIEMDGVRTFMDPWFVRAEHMEGQADTKIVVTNGRFTTSSRETPPSDVQASTIYIYPGDRIVAYHAFPRIYEIPFFYLPYLSVNLKRDLSRWDFEPGLSDRDGALLGVSYHYSLPRDDNPYTGSIYTDLRQKVYPGIGADFDYNGSLGNFSLFHFNTVRETLKPDDTNRRTENEEFMYRTRASGDLNFGKSGWQLQGNIDWQGSDRLANIEFRNLILSRTSRRKIDGALTHRSDFGLLTIQAKEDERIVNDGNEEEFVQNASRLPSIRYNMFSYPIPGYVGGPWNWRFSASSTRLSTGEESPFRWLSDARSSLSKTLPLFRGYSQKWEFGYRHQYNEVLGPNGDDFRSIASGIFSLENTFVPLDPMSLKIQYDLDKRFNKKDQINLKLNDQSLGTEEDGFREHALRFNGSWSGDNFYTFFRTGYDLRNSEQFDISSDSRVISPLLNISGQLTPTLGWSQFFRYDWGGEQLDQSNTRFELEPSKNFKTALGWNFNRGLDRDFSDLRHQVIWDLPEPGWRFRTNLVYDLETEGLDETRVSIYKRLGVWDFWLNLREVRDEGLEVTFNINLSTRSAADRSLNKELPEREGFLGSSDRRD